MRTSGRETVYHARTPEDLNEIAGQILASGIRVIFLQGELGAGKTTLEKAFCKVLGSHDEVTSPTFTLVNEYRDIAGQPIFHIDLYRLESVEDVIQIGIEDYVHSGAWCFIEWPELVQILFADLDCISIHIEINPDESRRIVTLK
jgi:tRNA threonylcarbamoyladenosine biosynthesis protein TsaE